MTPTGCRSRTYLKRDDRAVLPIGSTEQHAGLSLMVDSILAERFRPMPRSRWACRCSRRSATASRPISWRFPGTVSLRVETMIRLVGDILDSPVCPRLPPLRARQRPWRQPAGAVLCRRMGGRPSGLPREVPQLVERAEDLGGGEGDRSGRLARLLDGELSLDAHSGFPQPTQQKPMIDLERMRPDERRRKCAPISATAISAATTSGPTTRCCASGTSPSRRRAR